jgi:hypothetical protein
MMFDTLIGAAVEAAAVTDSDRELAVARPSRSVSAVREALVMPRSHRLFRDCVANRESHDNPRAVNRSSGAAGTYQFLPAWRNGLPYMVRDRLVRAGLPKKKAKQVRIYLSKRPIQKWPATYQTLGFAEAMHRGGSFHWRLAGSRCEAVRP